MHMDVTRRKAEVAHDRPTSPPPFDPATFARESERMLAVHPVDELPTRPRLETLDPVADSPQDGPMVSEVRLSKPRMPSPASVPTVAIAREDLEWFELDDDARALVESLDGATLDATLARQTDRKRAMKILLLLGSQGVIEFR
jgi:hypothetical protein